MIFTDPRFCVFFAIVLLLVAINARCLRSVRVQNALLLGGSYYFYAQWDFRFLGLIVLSTVVDYVSALGMERRPDRKRRWLYLSLAVNLGTLGFFKYYGFFVSETQTLLHALGVPTDPWTLRVILPVGISFYTFQTLTYTIDVYRGRLRATGDYLAFATYVAFFPQLVAGPIERAYHLLPQFGSLWRYDETRITEGLRLVLFGLALKVGVADNLAPLVDAIYSNPSGYNGGTKALGAVYFAFQIYGDFCGYSTIAVGLSKILGFDLMTNFRTPYFATSIRDFWHRWHISLSTFFRDYVYIPLGGSRGTPTQTRRNLLITFVLSGLWHGANWTFIVWGALHGALLILQNALSGTAVAVPRVLRPWIGRSLTVALVCLSWVIFRAETLTDAGTMLAGIFTDPSWPNGLRRGVVYVALGVALDFLWHRDVRLETASRPDAGPISWLPLRWATYVVMFWVVVVGLGNRAGIQQFIYFQF